MKRLLIAVLALAFAGMFAPMAHASQGSGCIPTSGSLPGLTLVQNINTAIAALISSNSGGTAPATDCTAAPVKGQLWLDTSVTPNALKQYDGTAAWLTIGSIDASSAVWTPPIGGGTSSLASAATVDLGSRPQAALSITSSTGPITSFGSSAAIGTIKVLTFAATPTVSHDATSLIIPGATSITVAAGDVWLVGHMGAGNWRVLSISRASGVPSVTAGAGINVTSGSGALTVTNNAAGAPCSWRKTMGVSPLAPTAPTTIQWLIGPGNAVVCDNGTWINATPATPNPKSLLLTNIGQGGFGTDIHNQVDITKWTGHGCVSPCVSTETAIGGFDPGEVGAGGPVGDTRYNIYLVARDASNGVNSYGLVLSPRGCTSGPSNTVQVVYPYYACIHSIVTNGAATAFKYMTAKYGFDWSMAGGNVSTPAVWAELTAAAGTFAKWTPISLNIPGLTDNSGSIDIILAPTTPGTFTAVTTNALFDTAMPPLCIVYAGQSAAPCRVTPDQGLVGLWSTDAAGKVYVIGGREDD